MKLIAALLLTVIILALIMPNAAYRRFGRKRSRRLVKIMHNIRQ